MISHYNYRVPWIRTERILDRTYTVLYNHFLKLRTQYREHTWFWYCLRFAAQRYTSPYTWRRIYLHVATCKLHVIPTSRKTDCLCRRRREIVLLAYSFSLPSTSPSSPTCTSPSSLIYLEIQYHLSPLPFPPACTIVLHHHVAHIIPWLWHSLWLHSHICLLGQLFILSSFSSFRVE